jgi:hypothetical protein
VLYPVELRADCGYKALYLHIKFRADFYLDLRSLTKKFNKLKFGRRGEIRTPDILLPKQARYQATLHAEGQKYTANRAEGQIYYDKMLLYFQYSLKSKQNNI